MTSEVCKKSGKLASDKCTETESKVFITRENGSKSWSRAADAKYMLPSGRCSKCNGDKDAPTIKLNGPSTITLKLNEAYVEQGATAEDKVDGNLTDKIKISGSVKTTVAGTYTITYSVKDSNDNETKATRKVIVQGNKTPATDDKKDKDTDTKKDDKDKKETNTTTNTATNSKT